MSHQGRGAPRIARMDVTERRRAEPEPQIDAEGSRSVARSDMPKGRLGDSQFRRAAGLPVVNLSR